MTEWEPPDIAVWNPASEKPPVNYLARIAWIGVGVLCFVGFIVGVSQCTNAIVEGDRRNFIETCAQLDAEFIDGQDGSWLCVRGGEVIYPN